MCVAQAELQYWKTGNILKTYALLDSFSFEKTTHQFWCKVQKHSSHYQDTKLKGSQTNYQLFESLFLKT